MDIVYFGTKSFYNDVTKRYGYQKNFPTNDEPLSMTKDVYTIIKDQYQDDEFFDPIYDENIEEDPNEEYPDETYYEDELYHFHLMRTSRHILLLLIKKKT